MELQPAESQRLPRRLVTDKWSLAARRDNFGLDLQAAEEEVDASRAIATPWRMTCHLSVCAIIALIRVRTTACDEGVKHVVQLWQPLVLDVEVQLGQVLYWTA
ncbi:hypothetical protein VC83_05025 [Pseudogymnoascus destructans]|uniref:Uncharacterized protein n=1 Tax=Pseudogymnoascus destructans TaxID=655981 RepID=A0A177A960_9PEZI|nr:uncharacterized protein VC83_05025 [Pseudogymnoascus destructans]OAF58659.1 hypothetical protein VC83_05025 [Pseudogymnoascus destructans]